MGYVGIRWSIAGSMPIFMAFFGLYWSLSSTLFRHCLSLIALLKRNYRAMIKILTFLLLVIAVAWLIFSPGWDSLIASGTSLVAFLTSLRKTAIKQPSAQSQTVSGEGLGIQAGRDVSIGNLNASKEADNAK